VSSAPMTLDNWPNCFRNSGAKRSGLPAVAGTPPLTSTKTNLMKQVVAIVKPFLAERVLEALAALPIEAISLHEVRGYGRQKSYLDATTEQNQSLAFLPKVEVECWVEDDLVELVIERLMAAARTGRMGDGKVFVLPVAAISG